VAVWAWLRLLKICKGKCKKVMLIFNASVANGCGGFVFLILKNW